MRIKITIMVVAVVISCVVGSAGATFYVMHGVKQSELQDLRIYYQNRTTNLTLYFQNNINNLTEEVEDLNQSLHETTSELEQLKSGGRYELHDPAYSELAAFIAEDETDKNTYDSDTFNCQHFTQTVNDNAESQGIRCAVVVIYFEETNTGHMIVGFNTTDQGMVYVEPQSDEWVENFVVGNEYWTDCIVPGSGYSYPDDPDDTIKEILVFW